jgi:2-amino-4-hydroxy-6-hydroxymethyldihydropteridine diphosphokinase
VKERHWGPRTVDIDLLAYDDVVVDKPELTLPHPRLFERAFVLVPLAEIAPNRLIGGVRVIDALARVDSAGIERLLPPEGGSRQG